MIIRIGAALPLFVVINIYIHLYSHKV